VTGQECLAECPNYFTELINADLICMDACPTVDIPADNIIAKPLVNKLSSGANSGFSICQLECTGDKPYIFVNSNSHDECASSCPP
jgi:hypothetical protein